LRNNHYVLALVAARRRSLPAAARTCDAPRYEAFEASSTFADNRASRTRARGRGRAATATTKRSPGKIAGQTVDSSRSRLPRGPRRGQQRFNIYCTPCHGKIGDGQGMVVQRGLRQAASYHQDRLRQEKLGYFYDVITNGFGAMQGYAEQIPVHDRWLIVAYVRTLQLSQHASVEDVPADRRGALDGAAPEAPQGNTVKPVEKH
jgi:mono/diheme cytochrome c family protein